jgi:dsDNA-specific endonuclease/ATPase MutS2
LQAKDTCFCNAGVEFDLATLRPTYRLMWQTVGASNALAVAEGLGFDPLVIEEAYQVSPPRYDGSSARLS